MRTSVNAYAKINLFLDIESMRPDGYHNIISFMQSVSLHDAIEVEYIPLEDKSIEIACSNESIPCDITNLAYKAADLYPIIGKIKISIKKEIPVSAGLAGGSTDAAAVLIALNSFSESPMTMEDLKKIGNKLGADVPFCIENGSCIATGTGDILKKAPSMPYYPIVIAKKGEGMSTPKAYLALDDKFNKFVGYTPKKDSLNILTRHENGYVSLDDYSKGLFNIFESVVEPCRPAVTELKNIMTAHGAKSSMMSGSGTSVFGLFENEEDAKKALIKLKDIGATAHLCYPIQK